eukprot:GFUD01013920.1.p2 GENE.GFUD01013920.1~~GFUD01013920.1.p2  ORF type:complete len:203 (+),score=71.69 GFUD01013920.1:103-711(+)
MVQARIRYEEGSYTGEVNDAKVPEGDGVFEYRGDDDDGRLCYDGEWKNKAAAGYGVMKWQNGDRYEGDWVEGLRQGKGKYISKSTGGKYEGEYTSDLKQGKGKYTFSNGDWYDGQWKEGLRHGHGTYVWKDKNEKFEGAWVGGVKEGTGHFTYASGDVFTGPYVAGNRHGLGELVKEDGEVRNENYKEGKLVNFTITKEKAV